MTRPQRDHMREGLSGSLTDEPSLSTKPSLLRSLIHFKPHRQNGWLSKLSLKTAANFGPGAQEPEVVSESRPTWSTEWGPGQIYTLTCSM